jgi:hypothetical protein
MSGGEPPYEELVVLAHLLGQVKPPTATRDEIERSGLQVVKGSELERLMQEGRVLNNTSEKCLGECCPFFARNLFAGARAFRWG